MYKYWVFGFGNKKNWHWVPPGTQIIIWMYTLTYCINNIEQKTKKKINKHDHTQSSLAIS